MHTSNYALTRLDFASYLGLQCLENHWILLRGETPLLEEILGDGQQFAGARTDGQPVLPVVSYFTLMYWDWTRGVSSTSQYYDLS